LGRVGAVLAFFIGDAAENLKLWSLGILLLPILSDLPKMKIIPP